MKKQAFFRSLVPHDRYMVGNLFFLYFIQGVFVILIGSILPMMKVSYHLDYQISGALISAHSVGNLLTGLIAGLLPMAIGIKRSLLLLNILPFLGFAITLMTGNPILLIFALLLTGIGRGAISNYNNQIISTISNGAAAPLNMLHACFAIGAVSAPFLALFCMQDGESGWRRAVLIVLGFGILSMVSSMFMKMDSVACTETRRNGGSSFGFLRDVGFVRSAVMMFFYLSVEATIMGWMVTYYIDSGIVTQDSAQILTSLLWVTILIGRLFCSILSGRFTPARIILVLSCGILCFLCILLFSTSLIPMLVGTIGLGLSLSGMYGTTVANAGTVFGEYPLAMGVFVTATSIGSVILPTIIGAIAEHSGIHMGMTVLLLPALSLLVSALHNHARASVPSKADAA